MFAVSLFPDIIDSVIVMGRQVVPVWERMERKTGVARTKQAAGSSDVIELHGSLWVWRCVKCGTEREERDVPFKDHPLACRCGGLRRPAMLWFGEPLPATLLEQAYAAAEGCQLLLSIGTSALVYPAAELPQVAQRAGAKVAEINSQHTPLTPMADWVLLGKAGEILPNLVETAISGWRYTTV
jgi:NAD-dependent deacetylase